MLVYLKLWACIVNSSNLPRAMSMQPSMFSLLLVMTEHSANDQVNESFK